MSYRTNRRTGGVFRTKDYTASELESQSRRYTCPRCEAMLGHDVSPASAQLSARMSGHETVGTPLASFISRAELSEHIRMMHPGQRFPTRTHRRIGRTTINITQTSTQPVTRRRRRTQPATEPMSATNAPDTMTAPTTETKEELSETESEGGIGGEGFTDDDGQIFDGQGGLLD
jgi:hypothetical protein